jgi:60 kDa SS-A/Ro ribonucleoprotein
VLPFRFMTALDALAATAHPRSGEVFEALSLAVDLSLRNVPTFPGRTLIALDTSGSMMGRPLKIGSLFAATLLKANEADLLLFSSDAAYLPLNRRDSTLSLAKFIEGKAEASSTNFHAIFLRARQAYDRILILSDMQGWVGHDPPVKAFENYKRQHGADPKVFSFDLQGYGSLMFPQRNVFCLAGFSEKTLETLHQLDQDPAALLRQIEAIEL